MRDSNALPSFLSIIKLFVLLQQRGCLRNHLYFSLSHMKNPKGEHWWMQVFNSYSRCPCKDALRMKYFSSEHLWNISLWDYEFIGQPKIYFKHNGRGINVFYSYWFGQHAVSCLQNLSTSWHVRTRKGRITNVSVLPFLFVHMVLNIECVQKHVSVYALHEAFWYQWHFPPQVSEVVSKFWSFLLNY